MKLILALSLLLILAVLSGCSKDILDIDLRAHKNLAMHIHPTLELEILGKQQFIPENTGISEKGMKVIHTHDSTGKLHIESPSPHQFYLRDFFTIWGKNFNSRCILQYCVDEEHELLLFVNGEENNGFEDILFKDGDNIKIVYRKK